MFTHHPTTTKHARSQTKLICACPHEITFDSNWLEFQIGWSKHTACCRSFETERSCRNSPTPGKIRCTLLAIETQPDSHHHIKRRALAPAQQHRNQRQKKVCSSMVAVCISPVDKSLRRAYTHAKGSPSHARLTGHAGRNDDDVCTVQRRRHLLRSLVPSHLPATIHSR